MADVSGVQSVVRAFALLELLCEKGELGVTQLSKLSGLSKATVFRFLNTLAELGYVKQNPQTEGYSITLKLLKISASQRALYDQRQEMRPVLERLTAECSETVHLVERNGKDIIYIDKIENNSSSFRMASRIGMSLPMVYTASGKAIMSRLTDSEIKQIWEESCVTAKTPNTITDFGDFLKEIQRVKEQGYALDNEENELGVCCIATAVCDIEGRYNYAVSVSVPTVRLSEDKTENIRLLLKTLVE